MHSVCLLFVWRLSIHTSPFQTLMPFTRHRRTRSNTARCSCPPPYWQLPRIRANAAQHTLWCWAAGAYAQRTSITWDIENSQPANQRPTSRANQLTEFSDATLVSRERVVHRIPAKTVMCLMRFYLTRDWHTSVIWHVTCHMSAHTRRMRSRGIIRIIAQQKAMIRISLHEFYNVFLGSV